MHMPATTVGCLRQWRTSGGLPLRERCLAGHAGVPRVAERGSIVNRFEALNVLGLDEQASDGDIRLAYYGVQKAIESHDFSDNEHLVVRVGALRDRAKEARDFLLTHGTGAPTPGGSSGPRRTGGVVGAAFGRKKRAAEKLSVTSDEEKKARLDGLEAIRVCLLTYRDGQASRRLSCLVVILICIVVGFIVLRYIRAMPPRIASFSVIAIAAIAGSTGFTTAHLQCRSVKRHLLDIDERIHELRVDLGLDDPDGDFDGDGVPNGEEKRTGMAGLSAARSGSRSSGLADAVEELELSLAGGPDDDSLGAGSNERQDGAWYDPDDADLDEDADTDSDDLASVPASCKSKSRTTKEDAR